MTLRRSLILSLFFLLPQPTKADSLVGKCLKELAIPTVIVVGSSALIGGIAWLYTNHLIGNVKLQHNTLMLRWEDLIAMHKNGLDLRTLIIADTWGLTNIPLHSFETELIAAINTTNADYLTARDCTDLKHLAPDLLALNTNLVKILREFAQLRISDAYAIEEQILLRGSVNAGNRILKMQGYTPTLVFTHEI